MPDAQDSKPKSSPSGTESEEERQRTHETSLKTLEATNLAGQLALKNSMLMNSGGALAVLTVCGHIAASGLANGSWISGFIPCLGCFVAGVFFVTLA